MLLKKATEAGIDLDEFKMIVEARLYKSKLVGKEKNNTESIKITTPGGSFKKDIPRGCKDLIINQYGTVSPTHEQMKEDYYNCQ